MNTKNLLVELLVEELPPKALKKIGQAFAETLVQNLQAQGLVTHDAVVTRYASPRRLAVHVADVAAKATDRTESVKLLPASVGFSNGQPTPPLMKKLDGLGIKYVGHEGVQRMFEKQLAEKREYLAIRRSIDGVDIANGLQKALADAIAKLPIPKVMTYQLADGWESVKFVRPAHGLAALHGEDVIEIQALGLTAGRNTQGHRFEASVDPIVLKNADSYSAQLQSEGAVIASFDARRAEIERQLQAAAAKVGGTPIHDDALLDEVTALVERPNVLVCQFEKEFLEVPQECLILTMKANQKYFPLLDAQGKLTNQFLVISNINPADPSRVIEGNERVVRPRLADAKFFFDQDRKKKLEDRVAGLGKVVYHNKLGTQGERVERVRAIAKAIGRQLGGDTLAAKADQAAQLAKADLLTDMVSEFPELQGIMGRYYALNDGLSADVADAIEDHYKPRFAGDELPRNEVGLVVALADKLETLVGLFGIGQVPTGDKDPFALRRHALGIIRMLIELELELDLSALVDVGIKILEDEKIQSTWAERIHKERVEKIPPESKGGVDMTGTGYQKRQFDAHIATSISDFIFERLTSSVREQGYIAQEIDAVISQRPQRLSEVPKRLAAVRAFSALPEAASLAAANKRVGNILKKSDVAISTSINESLLTEDAERHLHGALKNVAPIADSLFHNGEYAASLRELAVLKAPVDAFFDSVMVNADDPAIRANRLGLLAQLHAAMNRVADLSKLAA